MADPGEIRRVRRIARSSPQPSSRWAWVAGVPRTRAVYWEPIRSDAQGRILRRRRTRSVFRGLERSPQERADAVELKRSGDLSTTIPDRGGAVHTRSGRVHEPLSRIPGPESERAPDLEVGAGRWARRLYARAGTAHNMAPVTLRPRYARPCPSRFGLRSRRLQTAQTARPWPQRSGNPPGGS